MNSGSLSARRMASLTFLTTAAGVPLGAYRPCQTVTWKSLRPLSASVGRALSAGVVRRLGVVTA
ncbi:hypothetical protein D3C78_1484060 [compost metagenome]